MTTTPTRRSRSTRLVIAGIAGLTMLAAADVARLEATAVPFGQVRFAADDTDDQAQLQQQLAEQQAEEQNEAAEQQFEQGMQEALQAEQQANNP